MANDRSNVLLSEANKSLKDGKNSEALNLLDRAVAVDPDNPEIYELRGIAFAQLGRAEASIESFRKATMLAPNAGNFYNLAVQLQGLGETVEAKEAVSEALRLDPKHQGATKLQKKINGAGPDPQFQADGASFQPNAAARKSQYGFGKKHLFQVLGESQKEWMALGWTIVGLSVVATILIKFNFPLEAPKHIDLKNNVKDPFLGYRPVKSGAAFATIGFFITMILASMIWTSIDLIDRRGRALWMVPMMICCFVFMPFLPQSFYMVAGRKD